MNWQYQLQVGAESLIEHFLEWCQGSGNEPRSLSRPQIFQTLLQLAGGDQGDPPGLGHPERAFALEAFEIITERKIMMNNNKEPVMMPRGLEPEKTEETGKLPPNNVEPVMMPVLPGNTQKQKK